MTNVQEERATDKIKSLNIANKSDDVEDYFKYILTDCSILSKQYLHPVETSTTDTQKRSLANALPNRANSGIVLITTKLNQSDESKLVHYNNSSNSEIMDTKIPNKTNLKQFDSDQVVTKDSTAHTSLTQCTSETSEVQPKTATILVSKSKTKTGLPLLLKKSK